MIPRKWPKWWPEWDPIDVGLIRAWWELQDKLCPRCGQVHDSHDWPDTGWVTAFIECPAARVKAEHRKAWEADHPSQNIEDHGLLQITWREGLPQPQLNWTNDDEEA